MIKNNRFMIVAVIFFLLSIALNFPFPHEYPIGQELSSSLIFPIRTMDGLNFIGITGLLLLLISLYFLVKSLEKYHLRMVLITLLLVVFLPMELVSAYQKTLATGIYAINYKREKSNCLFDMKDDKTLYASCQLPFENYSNEEVQFQIEFYEKYLFEDDVPMVSLMNEEGPYEVLLHEKESEVVKIEAEIDISKLKSYPVSGEALSVNIMIKNGDRVRKL